MTGKEEKNDAHWKAVIGKRNEKSKADRQQEILEKSRSIFLTLFSSSIIELYDFPRIDFWLSNFPMMTARDGAVKTTC